MDLLCFILMSAGFRGDEDDAFGVFNNCCCCCCCCWADVRTLLDEFGTMEGMGVKSRGRLDVCPDAGVDDEGVTKVEFEGSSGYGVPSLK